MAAGYRGEPDDGFQRDTGGRAAHDRARLRADRERVVGNRAASVVSRRGGVFGSQGRVGWADTQPGNRPGAEWNHRQFGRARVDRDSVVDSGRDRGGAAYAAGTTGAAGGGRGGDRVSGVRGGELRNRAVDRRGWWEYHPGDEGVRRAGAGGKG